MKTKSVKSTQKQPSSIKSRDAVETAIGIAKRATATRWDEVSSLKGNGNRFTPWNESVAGK